MNGQLSLFSHGVVPYVRPCAVSFPMRRPIVRSCTVIRRYTVAGATDVNHMTSANRHDALLFVPVYLSCCTATPASRAGRRVP